VSHTADRVDEFANRFIPKVEILTALLISAQRWTKIDPQHPDAVKIRKEVARIDAEFTYMLSDLVMLVEECQPCMDPDNADHTAYETRIAPALAEMTARIKEVTREKEHYATGPHAAVARPIEESSPEFLIGSGRFFS
jgi:hypothetical protein